MSGRFDDGPGGGVDRVPGGGRPTGCDGLFDEADRRLLRSGHEVHLCWECVSGRGEEHRGFALERMRQAGAVVTNLESAAFEWCRHKDHPRFKELSALLKGGQLG